MRMTIVAVTLVAVLGLVVSCASKTAGPTPSAPTAVPATSTPVPSTSATHRPEEADWQRVVAAANKEDRLVFYSESMVGDIGLAVSKGFRQRTGLNVEIITGAGATHIERIKSERRAGIQVASVFQGAIVDGNTAKDDGLTVAIADLPELRDREVFRLSPLIDEGGHILSNSFSFQTTWVNTKLVKPEEEPKSFRDLLQPKWKGNIGVTLGAAPTVRAYYWFVRKEKILGDDYFRELGKMAVFSPTSRMDGDKLAKGDVAISFVTGHTILAPFLEAKLPVKPLELEEGVFAFRGQAMALLQGAPQSNAGRVFINWLFSQEGQTVVHRAGGTQSLRKDVPSFIPSIAQLSLKKALVETSEDSIKMTRLLRERVVDNLLQGK